MRILTSRVLGQLPTKYNSPPDKNKAQPLPTGTTIPRTNPHQDNSPLGPLPRNKTTHQDQYQYGGELSWWGVVRIRTSIPGVPERAERWIFSTLRAKSIILVYVIRSNIFRRRDWYQDHYIWLGSFDSICPFLEIRSFSNFARFLRPMSEELCRE